MFTVAFAFHIFICVVIVALVLLQQGKGADLGIAFGGNSQSLFGAAGAASVLVRATTIAAIVLFISSVVLIKLYQTSPGVGAAGSGAGSMGRSVLEGQLPTAAEAAAAASAVEQSAAAPVTAPAEPAAVPAAPVEPQAPAAPAKN